MKFTEKGAIAAFGAAALISSASIPLNAYAQAPINVTVDGDIVQFGGQKPVQQFGSVLVPLRGVFEKLGATVAYDGGSKSILAVRGATTVTLKLGSREAVVNQIPRTLSVPAQAVGGTTLVPLRFVSEALGADVKWNAASRTVIVSSTPGSSDGSIVNNPNVPAGEVNVTSLTYSGGSDGAFKGGDTLKVMLNGTPGGTATFSLPGIESAKSVALREVSSGRYEGTFTIPPNFSVKGASLLASLKVGNASSPLIQGGQPITIDSVGPKFEGLSPAPGSSVPQGKTLIYGTFSDAGTGINRDSFRLTLNENDFTNQVTVTESFFSFQMNDIMAPGRKNMVVVLRDNAGNETRKPWFFNVVAGVNPVKSVTVEPSGKTLEPGDVLTVQMVAAPGGKARYSLGDVAKNRAMNETTPGTYVGTYTLRKGDNLAGIPVTAVYTATGGEETTQTVEQSVQVASGTPDKPTITNPKPGDSEGGSVTITGTAAPGATVRYSVRYDGQLLILPTGGAITDGEVKADEKGNWTTSAISLSAPLGISNISYTITAVAVGASPTQTSEPTEVKFKK